MEKYQVVRELSLKEYIAMRVIEKRKQHGISQTRLAKGMCVKPNIVWRIENAQSNYPIGYIEKLCKFFNCPSSDIIPF